MAKKTVLNRAAKKLINATDDASIMSDEAIQAFNEADEVRREDVVAEQVAADVKENANSVPFPIPEQTRNTVEGVTEEVKQESASEKVQGEVVADDEVPDFMK